MGHGKPPPRRCGKGYRTGRYSKPIVAPRARGKKLRRGGGGPQWLSHIVFLGPVQRDSNPPGCGAEETHKRFPAQHARSEATKRGAGGASRTRTSLIAHHLIEKAPSDGSLSFLGPVQRDSNPPGCGAEETHKRFPAQHARSEAGSGRRNGPLANTRVQKMPNMSTATFLVAAFSKS